MGKAARLRQERERGKRHARPLLCLVFVDVDYDRGSRAHGRGVVPAPPEAWAVGRSGLVRAEWDGTRLRETGAELVDGPHPASSLVRALEGREIIVGHGILTADLRAAVMVTDVPDSLLRRVIDTLAFAWRIRGVSFPAGCNLSALVAENLGSERQKSRYPGSAPGLRHGSDPSPHRGDHDPCADARLVAALWERWVTTRRLSWGPGAPSWTCEEGHTRDGSPGRSAALTAEHIAELTGRRPHAEAAGWRSAYRWGKDIDPASAALLANLSAADLPAPTVIRKMARRLQDTGMIPAGQELTDEDLYTACQYLGAKQNLEVRERLARGRDITKPLREPLAWALWQSTHPDWLANPWTTDQKRRIRAQLETVVS